MIIVPDSPSKLGFNPKIYSNWRPGQQEVISRIVNSDKKLIILRAPTGRGKSLIAFASSILLNAKSCFLVSTKQLGKQYLEFADLELVEATGKDNFNCIYGGSCSEGKYCVLRVPCPDRDMCPYYIQRDIAINSQKLVTNYAYFLASHNYTKAWRPYDFLVLDECDSIEAHLMSFVSADFGRSRLKSVGLYYPNKNDDIDEWIQDGYNAVSTKLTELSHRSGLSRQIIGYIKVLQSLEKKFIFLKKYYNSGWIVDYSKNLVSFKPLYVKSFSFMLFNHVYKHDSKILLMSATTNKLLLRKTLNIPDGDYEYIEMASTFSPKRRALHIEQIANMKYNGADNKINYEKITNRIDEIIEKHDGEKGLIHTVSSDIAKYIYEHSFFRDIMIEAKGSNRINNLNKFIDGDVHRILLSPSFERGVNLPYDLCRFQVITKIPYLSIGDLQTRIKAGKDKEWYLMETVNRLIQAYGRGMRSEDDFCTTYLLDSRFPKFINRYRKLFSQDFLDAIKGSLDLHIGNKKITVFPKGMFKE